MSHGLIVDALSVCLHITLLRHENTVTM